ncbi:MAG: bifunctional proline dehydrogenase/L-glutamate gamma-semialdehyde dehydrogenase [Gammaproteobacteria bacterium RIFCSPHIGHO2_12_FULL_43_28]|nr:MAG: bifunctional proline dehydrogenase/L-glutamate gamma-semialdehyde dehydrogenase [Gammaproteobacteria bacterium RIFCSPHIGHO2_12_FULL_43_28]
MLTTTSLPSSNPLRDDITKAYRMDETTCLNRLLTEATLQRESLAHIAEAAKQLVEETREQKKRQGKIDTLLHQYDLSTDEGIALMCLAEALLRIPDKTTMDTFISDKISTVEWKNHLSTSNSFFVNAATWSLLFTGKIYAPTLDKQRGLFSALKRTSARLGTSMIRPVIFQMMKTIGNQFVMGQDIAYALKRATKQEKLGYRYSYDMLGEAARTNDDAAHYFASYERAIDAIGKAAQSTDPATNPGISVKLSALSPRYEHTQHHRAMQEVVPQLLALAQKAKQYHIGLTVDAEEADRLDLSLDIFTDVFKDPALNDWDGLGLAVQAYQKRAPYVIDYLAALAEEQGKRIMVRLVKGAYWDAEIKMSQVQGLINYPVFTRKNATDVSYLACANKLLQRRDVFFPQFATHNAYSVAAILEMAGEKDDYEFQCLHGMGAPLFNQIVDKTKFNRPCRVYAPVGTHKDLLGYLVRRLLENGANSSFVNRLDDSKTPIDEIIADPVSRIASLTAKPHPKIPLPKDIYKAWQNSSGIDLSDRDQLIKLKKLMEKAAKTTFHAASLINGKARQSQVIQTLVSPANTKEVIGSVSKAEENDVDEALAIAYSASAAWAATPVDERATILERAAILFEEAMPTLMTIITREGGRSIPDCLSEVREAIDFCRYYAYRARIDLATLTLPSPTGESNQLSMHPRGVIACISPWNFPLAIFIGQIVAALVAGNPVIAKPAEQTPLIAHQAVQLLHQAGIPKNVLQLLIGRGSVVGAKLVADPRVAGVIFTGSTETAQFINKTLAERKGPLALFVAETGGQNAMIVDSSALLEQTVVDIAQSAFNSAGQRCSALRVLFVQEDIAERLLTMLKGHMAEMTVGNPCLLTTDVGPVIDQPSLTMLKEHYQKMLETGELIAKVPLPETPPGHYFAPCAFEIKDLSILEGEVFGPILHVIRYRAQDLDKVMDAIIKTGYGLTLGIHSRIDATVRYIANRMPVGNIYVNRNMIGAVVGVQPFGGEGLSGTGPKAGGPHYLPRLCVERALSNNITAIGGNARLVSLLEDD